MNAWRLLQSAGAQKPIAVKTRVSGGEGVSKRASDGAHDRSLFGGVAVKDRQDSSD
jgi:hypothetical protein